MPQLRVLKYEFWIFRGSVYRRKLKSRFSVQQKDDEALSGLTVFACVETGNQNFSCVRLVLETQIAFTALAKKWWGTRQLCRSYVC